MNTSKKIVLLGHFGVGKTSIIRQFVTNAFSSDYKVTIGVHILKKDVVVEENTISLIIWDIEGTDNINLINKAYLLGSHAFVFAYDITRPATYLDLNNQIEKLRLQHINVPFKIVGNKMDLIASVDTTSENHKAIIKSTDYLTSAKTGENIEALFNDLAVQLLP